MVAVGGVNGLFNFKTIFRRMVWNFATLTIVTIIVFITIGTFANYLDGRKRTYEQLEIISTLKAAEIQLTLERLQRQVSRPLEDTAILRLVQSILTGDPQNPITQFDIGTFRTHIARPQRPARRRIPAD